MQKVDEQMKAKYGMLENKMLSFASSTHDYYLYLQHNK